MSIIIKKEIYNAHRQSTRNTKFTSKTAKYEDRNERVERCQVKNSNATNDRKEQNTEEAHLHTVETTWSHKNRKKAAAQVKKKRNKRHTL